jgi:hypothetical protein
LNEAYLGNFREHYADLTHSLRYKARCVGVVLHVFRRPVLEFRIAALATDILI